jgi:hypothetical protein
VNVVRLAVVGAKKSIDYRRNWQDGTDSQEDGSAQKSGKDLLAAKEEIACRDEESKAHGRR